MKKIHDICRNLLLSLFIAGWGTVVYAADLAISIDNPPSSGIVELLLFDSANTFGDLRDPVRTERYRLDNSNTYIINNIPSGEYALLVHYDENDNNRIDKNFIGIPKEPLGFSNGYRPKGPPSYNRVAFVLTKREFRKFDVELHRPLGKLGRLGVGVGVIAQSSPYRDYHGGVYQVIPAIVYTGERFQIYGPYAQIGLVGSGKSRLAVIGEYRIGAYEEEESDYLAGMGDRKSTFMAGLAFQTELPGGVDLSACYDHDVLGEIGGGTGRLELDRGFQLGIFRLSTDIGLNWLSSVLSNHDYGVPSCKSTLRRPVYNLNNTISVEGGMGMFVEIGSDWLVIVNGGVELLDAKVTASPIVSDGYIIKGFATISYVF